MNTNDFPSVKTGVLLVDDDAEQRAPLRVYLESQDYQVLEAENGAQALELLDQHPALRLVISDLDMPVMDGIEFVRRLRAQESSYHYVIVLTVSHGQDALRHALSAGADDFVSKPAWTEELRLRLAGGQRLMQLEIRDQLIFSLAKLVEYRSEETGAHLERVRAYVRLLASSLAEQEPELGLTPTHIEEIVLMSPLHDIGKIGLPDRILHKPDRLTMDEFEEMKAHTRLGGELMKNLYEQTGAPYLRYGYEISRHHHERWAGGGYPDGLVGEEIPLAARIMAVADVYDALTSARSYKAAFSHEDSMKILRAGSGKQFDPRVIATVERNETEWLAIKGRFGE